MLKSNRVLVVSPDPGLVNQVKGSLTIVEVDDVTDAPNAEDALNLFSAEKHRLVIAEVDLPGITGQELCRRLKAIEGGEAPVVALIYRHDEGVGAEQCQNAGADTCAGRPFQSHEFIEKLREVIDSVEFNRPSPAPPAPAVEGEDSVSDESLYSDYEFDAGESIDDMAILDSQSIRPADTAEMEAVKKQGDFEEVATLPSPTSHSESSVRIASLPVSDFEDSFLPQHDSLQSSQVAPGGGLTLRETIAEHLEEMTAEGSSFREEIKEIVRSIVAEEVLSLDPGARGEGGHGDGS